MSGLYQQDFLDSLARGVESLLPVWGLSPASRLALLCISENATFRVDCPKRRHPVVIRVHRPGYHSLAEIESELAWITALRAQSSVVTTAEPLVTSNGDLVTGFEHDGEQRFVVAFEFLPGIEPSETGDLRADFESLGAITARLHAQAKNWPRPSTFVRKTWDFETMLGNKPHWGNWREALGLDEPGRELLERCAETLQRQLAEFGKGPERFGLIHADLRLANLLVDGDQLAVIDFDDCGFSWYLYDFAAAISFIETSPQIPALQSAWVTGYRSVGELSREDEQALPMFVMLRRLLLTAWIASHSETPTAAELGSDYTLGTLKLARAYLGDRSD